MKLKNLVTSLNPRPGVILSALGIQWLGSNFVSSPLGAQVICGSGHRLAHYSPPDCCTLPLFVFTYFIRALLPVFVNKVLREHSCAHLFVCVCGGFWQSWIVVIETAWLARPKILSAQYSNSPWELELCPGRVPGLLERGRVDVVAEGDPPPSQPCQPSLGVFTS